MTAECENITGKSENPRCEPDAFFDYAALIRRMMGDKYLAAKVISGFLEDMPVQMETLRMTVMQQEKAAAVRQAHKIKGSAANVGALEFSNIMYDLEDACREFDLQKINRLFALAEEAYHRLQIKMEGTIHEDTHC